METISNMAQTAVKAVWGDSTAHNEPASGLQGDVSKGEPYDGGNIDPKDEERRDSKFTTEEGESLKETPDTKKHTETLSSTTESAESTSHESNKDSVQNSEEESIKAEEGPRPLAAVAKENGGDAGNVQAGSESTSTKTDAANAANADHTEDKSSESKATGEKYVRTTGLAADGGNFDATNPGAGREADRLMEEKGVVRQDGGDHPKPDSSSSGSGSKDGKPSLKEKIKDKLHIHKS